MTTMSAADWQRLLADELARILGEPTRLAPIPASRALVPIHRPRPIRFPIVPLPVEPEPLAKAVPIPASPPAAWNIRARRVGGIWFLRAGQFQLSFCRTRKPF